MKYLSLTVLAFVSLPQNDETPESFVRKLADPDITVREGATRRLVEFGEAAVVPLKDAIRSADLEVQQRAEQALVLIEQQAKIRKIYRDRKPFDLALSDARVEDVLKEITRRTGVTFSRDQIDLDRRVTVSMTGGTLIQALDLLCADLRDTQWAFEQDEAVGFSRQAFVGKPGFYAGPFKISIKRLDLYRTSNFREASGMVSLYLEAQAERTARMTGTPLFTIKELVDDTATELSLDPSALTPLQQMAQLLRAPQDAPGTLESKAFTYHGLNKFARKIGKIRGTVTFFFALGTTSVALDDLSKETRAEVGEFTIQINDTLNGCLQAHISRNGSAFKLDNYLDADSISVTDTQGGEHSPLAGDLQFFNVSPGGVSFYIYFDRSGLKQAKSVRFSLVSEFYEKQVPFEFTNVPLP